MHLAAHALRHGFGATISTYNVQLFDPSWFEPEIDVQERLRRQAEAKTEPRLREATDAYLEFLELTTADEYRQRGKELLKDSELILAQTFLKSDYDWWIGVLDGEAIFACRYFMAKGHWQVIQHVGDLAGAPTGAPCDAIFSK